MRTDDVTSTIVELFAIKTPRWKHSSPLLVVLIWLSLSLKPPIVTKIVLILLPSYSAILPILHGFLIVFFSLCELLISVLTPVSRCLVFVTVLLRAGQIFSTLVRAAVACGLDPSILFILSTCVMTKLLLADLEHKSLASRERLLSHSNHFFYSQITKFGGICIEHFSSRLSSNSDFFNQSPWYICSKPWGIYRSWFVSSSHLQMVIGIFLLLILTMDYMIANRVEQSAFESGSPHPMRSVNPW